MKENPEDFTDIVLDVFKVNTKKIELTEGVIPITPFVAYAAFKKKVFNALKNSKLFRTVEKIKRTPTKIKAKTVHCFCCLSPKGISTLFHLNCTEKGDS